MSIHVWGATGFEANFAATARGEDGWQSAASTTPTFDTSIKKRGAQAIKCPAVSTGQASGFKFVEFDGAEVDMALGDGEWGYLQGWLYVDDATPAAIVHFVKFIYSGGGGDTPSYIGINTDGKVQVYKQDASTALGSASGSAPFTSATWHNVQVGARKNGSNVEIELYVDDLATPFFTQTIANPWTALQSFQGGATALPAGAPNVNIWWDEAVMFDLSDTGNTRPEEDIETLTVLAGDTDDQTYNDFTHIYNGASGDSSGTEWHTQDDSTSNAGTVATQNDGNASYGTRPAFNTADIRQTYRMRNPSHPTGRVAIAVNPRTVAQNFTGTGGTISQLIREGSSDVEQGSITLSGFDGHGAVLNTKPSGGGWTNSAVDDLQIGLRATAAASPRVPRITKTLMVVVYMDEVAAGAPDRRRLLAQEV